MIPGLDGFVFLRPLWLWALPALPALAWWWHRRHRRADAWRGAVDPHLLAHLLVPVPATRRWPSAALAVLGAALAVLALAGPSWRQGAQSLWSGGRAMVVAVDLSSATLAGDLPPSRLAQSRAKLAQLLRERDGAPVALVVFAGDAYTVAPLTDDARNVALFVDALAPDVMPIDGHRADRAIEWSAELLRRAGHGGGGIVLIAGQADDAARQAAAAAAAAGYEVSVLGLGTAGGALYRDRDGAVRQARLDPAPLAAVARAGGGRYAALEPGDGDLRALGLTGDAKAGMSAGRSSRAVPLDDGYWLLPPLILLALFAFRRHAGAAVLALCLCLPPVPAQAGWWQRADQAAQARLQAGVDAYRAGRFEDAARLFASADTADAHYNRGNALARAGRLPQALAAYDAALERQPGMPDAVANRRAVEAAMKRQPPKGPANKRPGQAGAAPPRDAGPSGPPSGTGDGRPAPSQQAPAPPPAGPPRADSAQAREAQRAADAAQRERMQRELARGGPRSSTAAAAPPRAETAAERERRIANDAWLRRVPDEPGGLLRAKLRLEHERRQQEGRGP